MGLPQNERLGEGIWKTWKIITGTTERQLETPQNKTKQNNKNIQERKIYYLILQIPIHSHKNVNIYIYKIRITI